MTELETWLLAALPLLFAAGWWLRGWETRRRAGERRAMEERYFRGLSLLISDKPDKAIDQLLEVARLDADTAELHHSLGNLLRFRGQFDQAIRLHTSLARRAELPAREREQATSELAQDFLAAGLYDRAEDVYRHLLEAPRRRGEALAALRRIYCVEGDWERAIEIAGREIKERGSDLSRELSHYWCERAEAARRAGASDLARDCAEQALKARPDSVRALSLSADLALHDGRREVAAALWDQLGSADPAFLPLIAAAKADALAEESRDRALDFLEQAWAKTGSQDILALLVARLSDWRGPAAASAMALRALRESPSLALFALLCERRQRERPDDQEAGLLRDLTAPLLKRSRRYQCRDCGFLARSFQWQCPGCRHWDSFAPRRVNLDLD